MFDADGVEHGGELAHVPDLAVVDGSGGGDEFETGGLLDVGPQRAGGDDEVDVEAPRIGEAQYPRRTVRTAQRSGRCVRSRTVTFSPRSASARAVAAPASPAPMTMCSVMETLPLGDDCGCPSSLVRLAGSGERGSHYAVGTSSRLFAAMIDRATAAAATAMAPQMPTTAQAAPAMTSAGRRSPRRSRRG